MRSKWVVKIFGMVLAEGYTIDTRPLFQCPRALCQAFAADSSEITSVNKGGAMKLPARYKSAKLRNVTRECGGRVGLGFNLDSGEQMFIQITLDELLSLTGPAATLINRSVD